MFKWWHAFFSFLYTSGKIVLSYKLAIIQKQFWRFRHQIQTINMRHSLCKLNLTSKVDLRLPHVPMFEPSVQKLLWITWCMFTSMAIFTINAMIILEYIAISVAIMSHFSHLFTWAIVIITILFCGYFCGITYIDSDEEKHVIDIYTLNITH